MRRDWSYVLPALHQPGSEVWPPVALAPCRPLWLLHSDGVPAVPTLRASPQGDPRQRDPQSPYPSYSAADAVSYHVHGDTGRLQSPSSFRRSSSPVGPKKERRGLAWGFGLVHYRFSSDFQMWLNKLVRRLICYSHPYFHSLQCFLGFFLGYCFSV